ncbi:MAG: X-Pro dipeptidyl-peptidase, partial [Ilumatobacteraceae bacterium]|nr:X-Pro dipeptidyl-peptidase [Ilumatobacteraceae bacterium]
MIPRRCVALVALATLAAASCSSSSSSGEAGSTSTAAVVTSGAPSTADTPAPATTDSTAPPDTAGVDTTPSTDTAPSDTAAVDTSVVDTAPPTTIHRAACVAPETRQPVEATGADTAGQDWDITSFDGTVIRAHWFPEPGLSGGATAPTVLMGPGWGSPGDTDASAGDGAGSSAIGVVGIATLRNAGFNVLTWDPRGFGESTGTVEIDSPKYEGRDVEQLIDWVATQPGVELDAPRDPRMGMFGASYGGGIQLVTASIDCRVDAIVPVIAWNSLQTSLFKADTAKIGWATFLSAVSNGRDIDPVMARANAASNANGVVDPADVQWFADRGPGDAVGKITVPTLIIQGTVDTLFTLDEGATNFTTLQSNGVPTAMLWFCGGHGACLTDDGDASRTSTEAIAWLQRYVAGGDATGEVPKFAFVDQDGTSYTADAFPLPEADPLVADGTGTLDLTADGGAGPATIPASAQGLGSAVAPITPGKATNAVNVTIPAPAADTVLVGAP